jgi:FMN reductase
MSRSLKIVAVSGSLHHPSKTTALVESISARLEASLDAEVHLIRLDLLGPRFAGVLRRDELPDEVEAELVRIETADLLVVASPVYRASFTGLFKHLFDFVDQYALVDTPVLLAATGGSERHALIIEHQFRPLFSFFQALTLPLGIYAHDSDFVDYTVHSEYLSARIAKVVARSTAVITANFAEKEAITESLDRVTASSLEEEAFVPVRLFS